ADAFEDVAVPAGSLIIMSPWVVHRDPRWWERPTQFDIQRFLNAENVPRGAYFPFGAGARMCIGRDMALLEGTIALQHITSTLRLRPTSPAPVAINASVTLRPAEPVLARVEWRGP
ncbi:MAG: cytochrome P450, partial [Actinobacteria bacterium]|nr:cytochrome P450 [Actinomycetota bacterium]